MSVSRSIVSRGSLVSTLRARSSIALAAMAAIGATNAFAVDGTWSTLGGGSYDDTLNWVDGLIAEGTDATANFSTLDLNGVGPVVLTAPRTIGNFVFGDTDVSTPGGYTFSGAAFTLSGASPTITNNGLGVASVARFDNVLTGTTGLTLTGPGTTHLAAPNTYTGNTTLNSANVILGSGAVFNGNNFGLIPATGTVPTVTLNGTNTIGTGTTASGTVFLGNNVVASAGSVTTFNLGRRFSIGQNGAAGIRNWTGTGSLIFNLATQESRNDFLANFNAFAGNITFTAQQYTNVNGTFSPVGRLQVNGGNFGAGFTAANVTLSDFAVLQVSTGSGGSTVSIGALSGTSNTAGFLGGTAGALQLNIGALNTNTSFSGLFLGSTRIFKVGTGSLTLASPQTYTGITQIDNGTLALSGDANLNASPSINVVAATSRFDVGSVNGGYSTALNQTLLGRGTVVGSYTHDEGVLSPGANASAGTLSFANDLSLVGGQVNFDLSLNTAPGGTNDLLAVTGALNLGGNTTLNLVGNFSGGTYTLANAGSVGGSTAGWTILGGSRGATLSLIQAATTLQLQVTAGTGANLVYANGPFDISTSQSFTNNGSPDRFFQGDAVRFDDTAGNFAVVYEQALLPSNIVVDAANNYTFSSTTGAGNIGGSATLTKRGTGTLTINTNNSFTGGTTVEAGTLDVLSQQNAIGTGTLRLGVDAASNTLFRFTTPTGSNQTIFNPIVVAGTTTLELNNGSNVAVPPVTTSRQTILNGPISGNGTLNLTTAQPAGAALVLKGIDVQGNTRGFSGAFNIGPNVAMRWQGVNGDLAGSATAAFSIGANASMATIITANSTIPLGSLTGTGTLRGHSSSGSGGTINYEIGALNTSTTFDGTILNGAQGTVVRPVLITKVGTGSLTLTGANTYTGNTTVVAGTLVLGANAQQPVFGGAAVAAPAGVDVQGGKVAFQYADAASGAATLANVDAILTAGFGQTADPFETGLVRSTTLVAGRTLGFRDNGAGAVEVAYTLPGDADLSFSVGFDDLLALAQNYNGVGDKNWSQGDFNYDNVVGFDDLLALAQNYNQSLSVSEQAIVGGSFAADYALALSQVPEPTTLGLLAGGLTLLARRRRVG